MYTAAFDKIIKCPTGVKFGETYQVPDSVETIGSGAFDYVGTLTGITMKNVKIIGEFAFEECENLKNISFGDKLINIGSGAFYNCTVPSEVVLPKSIKTVEYKAFYGIENFTLHYMGSKAEWDALDIDYFSDNYTMKYNYGKYVPVTQTSITSESEDFENGVIAVGDTMNLVASVTPEDATDQTLRRKSSAPEVAAVKDGVITGISNGNAIITVSSKDGEKKDYNVRVTRYCGENAEWSFDGKTLRISGIGAMEGYPWTGAGPWYDFRHKIDNVVVEEGITEIGRRAFLSFDNAKSVKLPKTLKKIGTQGLFGWKSLKFADLSMVETIADEGFECCSALTEVNFGKGLKTIEVAAFNACNALVVVNYEGTEAEWKKIDIKYNNNRITGDWSKKNFESFMPTCKATGSITKTESGTEFCLR